MRRFGGYVLLAALAFPVCAQAQQKPSNSMHTRSAEIYLDRAASASANDERDQLLTKALEVLSEGIAADAGNPRLWFMAGQAYARMGDAMGADSSFRKAESMWPDYAEEIAPLRLGVWIMRYNAGVAAIQAGDMAKAVTELEAADHVYRGRPEAALMLGSIYAQQGDLPSSEKAYRTALEIAQGPAAAHVAPEDKADWVAQEQTAADRLAILLSQLGRHDEAIQVYQSVIERHPTNAQAKADMAAALAAAGRADEATAVYEELLAGADLSDVAWFNAGVRLYSAQQPELAAKAFRKSTEVNPYSRDAQYNLGQALYAIAAKAESVRDAGSDADLAGLNAKLREVNQELLDVAMRIRELDPAARSALMMVAQAQRTLSETAADDAAKKEWQDKVVATLEEAGSMPFEVTSVTSRALPDGSVALAGTITNLKLPAGQTVTLEFSLLDESGHAVETDQVSVQTGEPDTGVPFEFTIKTDATIMGWKYTVAS